MTNAYRIVRLLGWITVIALFAYDGIALTKDTTSAFFSGVWTMYCWGKLFDCLEDLIKECR